ncbi:unnamed protein product [Prorocentrum cordatum]|uniref:Major facilitator superfamily (MFS) profile domain-containing protein n=1 Tax=Prorocentrum cordatum TaxID=2364126 RepID=A0ABN9TQX7_9DINO|nr:unnamed protein product [Polarella glacialis]
MAQTADEGKVVAVLAVGFGLVGFDRFLISTMFPVIAADMGLGYADIGSIAGALSLSWGTAALLCGNLSDRVGRRRVLVGSFLMFSLLIGASGLATGLSSLIMVRVLLGFADGAFTPASISATIESSSPEHVGRNIGIQQMMLTLCGLGISPLAVAALLHVMDWRWVFSVFVIPALLTAWLTARIIPDAPAGAHNEKQGPLSDLKLVLSYRNVWIAMMTCCVGSLA